MSEVEKAKEAINAFDKAIKLKPDFADAFNLKGATFAQLRRFEEALRVYEKAIELMPSNDELVYRKGLMLLRLRQYEKAVAVFNQVLKLNTRHYIALIDKGMTPDDVGQRQRSY